MANWFLDWVPYLRLLFAVALIFFVAFVGLGETRRLQRNTSSAARLALYRSAALMSWVLASAGLLLAVPVNLLMLERAPSDIPWLLGSATAGRMAIILLGCVFALAIGPSLIMGSRPALRRKFTKAVWRYRYFLPATREERRWWLFLSLTAGVCEELLFRGYLLQYLSGRMEGGPALGLTGAWLVSSAAFGFGHLYQGARGVLGAALAGLALGLLAIMTGDLLLPILAHAVVDASALLAYRPQDDDPAQAGLLIRGCDLTREG